MPANPGSLVVTDSYRLQLLQLRTRVVRVLTGGWQAITIDDLEESHRAWRQFASELLALGKEQAATLSGAYLGAFLSTELGRQVSAPRITPAEYGEASSDGRPLADALAPSLITVRMALANRRALPEALAAGLARAQTLTAMEIGQAGRQSLADGMSRTSEIRGWRRATTGGPCGACIAAATGAIRATDEVPDVHAYCRCVAEPVMRGLQDRAPRPTGPELFEAMSSEQQDALFAGRGGHDKAELIRAGDVPLDALIQRQPMAAIAD